MEIVFVHQFIHENAPVDEKDVLEQRDELAEIFINMGYAISSRSIQSQLDLILLQELANKDCIVFNLCESLFGRDDLLFLVPFMLEHYNIPFTGSGSMALALSCHKLESKSLMINNFIPTPKYITSSTPYSNNINGTYIIKPYNTHASMHITQDSVIRVHSKHDFDLLLDRLKTSHALFAEEYIDGREFNISLMQTDEGVLILPHAEIIFENYPPNMYKIVDYDAKWAHDSFAYEHTIRNFYFPEDDSPLLNEIDRLSLKVWELFSLNGYARIDYRIRGNEIFILEVNANPCISIYSGFMAAVKQYGLSFQDALDIILKHPIKTNKINI